MHKPTCLILVLSLITISRITSAGTMGASKSIKQFAAVGGGAYITAKSGSNRYFPIENFITDEFYIYHAGSSQTAGMFDVFAGANIPLNSTWSVQAGLDYNQTTRQNMSGTFIQGADDQSADTWGYKYNLINRQLLILGKFLYDRNTPWHPYLAAGIGVAFNQSSNFSTTVPPFLTFTRMYENNNHTAFSYAAGAGFDLDIRYGLRLGAGYRFTDFGKNGLGSAHIDDVNVSGSLQRNNLYSNAIFAQLTWIAQ